MKKSIVRNIAILSAVFMTVFSIMLITNYFQVSSSDTIRSEMIENLKQANEEMGGNSQLQEQIRELDLLARKAYFINLNRLKTGIGILLAMSAVFVVSLRIYYAKNKNIPAKEIEPIDDWFIKSKTRKYVVWIASGLAVGGVVFALLTSPFLKSVHRFKQIDTDNNDNIIDNYGDTIEFVDSLVETNEQEIFPTDTLEISKVTHNGFRGNNSLGISNAKNIPTSWDLASGKNILWKVNVPRKGYNSPIINGNKLFFRAQMKRRENCFATS